MNDYYRYVVIETYQSRGESSRHTVSARALPDQGLSTTLKVECSTTMRELHPLGTKFKVLAKVKNTNETPHLYSSWQWPYEVLSNQDAEMFIKAKKWGI